MDNNNNRRTQSSRSQLVAGIVIVLIGIAFLLQRELQLDLSHLLLPLLIIGLGVWLLVGQRRSQHTGFRQQGTSSKSSDTNFKSQDASATDTDAASDFFRSTAVFSEQRKVVTTSPLRGGDIVNVFGGTDVNLLQATVQGPIVIKIFQLFGGTKIVVPAHWNIHSEVTSIFGEVDDRRFNPDIPKDRNQIVHLRGTSIFGGITIKSM